MTLFISKKVYRRLHVRPSSTMSILDSEDIGLQLEQFSFNFEHFF